MSNEPQGGSDVLSMNESSYPTSWSIERDTSWGRFCELVQSGVDTDEAAKMAGLE